MELESLLGSYRECFDRFTFDDLFRKLLIMGFTNEGAKDIILFNCSLSLIIFQERIDNDFYKKIKPRESISDDLDQLIAEAMRKRHPN